MEKKTDSTLIDLGAGEGYKKCFINFGLQRSKRFCLKKSDFFKYLMLKSI